MKAKKHISILCFVLCLAMLLASCNQVNPSTDTSKASEHSSSNEIIEESSKAEESIADEESSEAEPAYQVEITEEMMKEYLKLRGIGFTLEELLKNYEEVCGVENYNYKADCIALGELNGYTMWCMLPGIAKGYIRDRSTNYVIGDYAVNCLNPVITVYYCLYKDNVFISLRDACAQGLINPDDAYALIKKNPRFEDTVKELSELDYQFEMTEEMANEFLKFSGSDETISEIMAYLKEYEDTKNYNYKDDYIAFGNLGGYTFCCIPSDFCHSYVNFEIGKYVTPDCKYLFESSGTNSKSRVNLYLYKDHTFITFEDACEQGLVDTDKAYELTKWDGKSGFAKKLTEEEANRYKELRKNAEKMYKK